MSTDLLKSNRKYLGIVIGGILIAGFDAPSAMAQQDDGARNALLEEIVITARRREESLQSVPIAVTAFSAEDMKQAGIETIEDLRFHAPSLQVSPTSEGDSVPGYTIRGQRQQQAITTQDASVAVYFADVPQGRAHGTNGSLYDLESVQVLKGPQGTLFGRNTTGGAILFNPAKPAFEPGVFGEISGEVGDYDHYGSTFFLNAGNDAGNLAVRVAGDFANHDNYVDSLSGNRDFASEDTQAWRVGLRWQPTETFETYFVYDYYKQENGGIPWRLVHFDASNANVGLLSKDGVPLTQLITAELDQLAQEGFYTASSNHPVFDDVENYNFINTTTWDIGDVTLKNIIGYRDISHSSPADYDSSAGQFNQLFGFPTAGEFSLFDSHTKRLDGDQFSEEFQILGTAINERLEWIVGVFYFIEENDDFQGSGIFDARENHGLGENESYSVYAQGSYDLASVEGLSITAGIRQTWDRRELESMQRQQSAFSPVMTCRILDDDLNPLDPCSYTIDYSDSAPTWTFSVDYQVSDQLLTYFAHRRGYRSGGLQFYLISTEQPVLTFDPETVDDYEVGFKFSGDPGGVPVRFNAAAYYQDYDDIQRGDGVIVNGSFTPAIFNAASANITGLELEGTIIPTDSFEISAFFGYTDAEYDEFFNVLTGQDQSDNEFAWVPETTAGVTARLRMPFDSSIGEIWLQGSWYTQDDQVTSDADVGPENFGILKGYDLFDVQLSWLGVFGNPNLDARLTVKNVTEEEYYKYSVAVYDSLGTDPRIIGEPRTVVGQITYRFGQ